MLLSQCPEVLISQPAPACSQPHLAPLALVFLCLAFLIHLLHFSAAYMPGAEEQGPRVGRRWALPRGSPHGAHSCRRLLFRRGRSPRAVAAGLTQTATSARGVRTRMGWRLKLGCAGGKLRDVLVAWTQPEGSVLLRTHLAVRPGRELEDTAGLGTWH